MTEIKFNRLFMFDMTETAKLKIEEMLLGRSHRIDSTDLQTIKFELASWIQKKYPLTFTDWAFTCETINTIATETMLRNCGSIATKSFIFIQSRA